VNSEFDLVNDDIEVNKVKVESEAESLDAFTDDAYVQGLEGAVSGDHPQLAFAFFHYLILPRTIKHRLNRSPANTISP
jgi:hypothetical protein